MRRLRAGQPIAVDGLTVIPLEATTVEQIEKNGGFSIYASKMPIGIAICSPQRVWALDIEGRPASMETFLEQVEGLRETLDSLAA